jgi:hypothetical protein
MRLPPAPRAQRRVIEVVTPLSTKIISRSVRSPGYAPQTCRVGRGSFGRPLGLSGAVPPRGEPLRPAHAHQEAIRDLFQRLFALIAGQQGLTAQIILISSAIDSLAAESGELSLAPFSRRAN